MIPDVIIAAEARGLLPDDPVPGRAVRWVPADAPLPAGSFVAVVPLVNRSIGAEEIERLEGLRIVANIGAGVDNIDLAAASVRGVVVTNTPDVTADATADLTMLLVLAAARRLKEGQRLIEGGGWTGWHPTQLLGMELAGRTLGVFGAGRIGQAVGRRAAAFGMRVCYAARTAKPAFERATGAGRVTLDRLLREADIVTLHAPSTKETRGIIDGPRLALMRPHALLINTARGDLIDEAALLAALAEGRLAGAGLDVYPAEPRVHPALIRHPRVVVLPHLGSATEHTRRAMAALAVRNVRAVLAGEAPVTPV